MTTTIKNREYKVEPIATGDATKADLIRRGWDGVCYMLTGKRGAVMLAYRNAKTGEFSPLS